MKKLVVVVVCSSVLTCLVVLVWHALSQSAEPVAAGDSTLSIPACAFAADLDSLDFFRGWALWLDSGSGYFYAPISLPHGSIIKKVMLICKDNNGSSDIELLLQRIRLNGGYSDITTVSSSGSENSYRTFAQRLTSDKYVNTSKYSYCLRVYLPGKFGVGYVLSQAKIVYTPPSP